ncbi:hypothetical protein L9F63_003135 [Diploptera punctata]|uniref:Uncharacterized protein n=1 Tax=Diploptera punctata TaxID=6984 RepID=A0AAD8EA53_DIPPU|nr:hypothetical protein L9F63_003135 [Diploptera punctata]
MYEDVTQHLNYLETFSAWNSLAKFVVVFASSSGIVSNKVVQQILSDMWKWKILNVVVLVQKRVNAAQKNDTGSEISLMTWFPYALPFICDKLQGAVVLNSWVSQGEKGIFRYNTSLFPNKISRNLKGCTLRVGTTNFHPFVSLLEAADNYTNFSIDGMDIRTLFCITKYLNMVVKILPNSDTNPWGLKLENGTWTGMSGDLTYNKIDIAVAGWADNLRDHLIFGVTKRYFTDMAKWYVPRAKPYPHWLGIIRVFEPNFWAALFLALSISSVFLRLISIKKFRNLAEETVRYSNILSCISDLWSMIISAPIPVLPQSAIFRFFFIFWLVYSFVVSTLFQTYVTSLLVDPGIEHQIASVEELIGSNLEFFLMRFLANYVDEQLLEKLFLKEILDTPVACLESAVKSGNAVTLLSKTFIMDSANKPEFKNKVFPLYGFRENFMEFHLVFVFKKSDPLIEIFDDIILHLVEAGLPAQFMREVTSSNERTSQMYTTEYEEVSIFHLLSAFVLITVSWGISILIFLIEILIPHVKGLLFKT